MTGFLSRFAKNTIDAGCDFCFNYGFFSDFLQGK